QVTRSDQDQNIHNHEQTLSETGKIEVTKESPKETRDDWVISITDKLEQADRDDDTTIWGKLCIYRPMTKTDQSKLENYLAGDKAFDPFADMVTWASCTVLMFSVEVCSGLVLNQSRGYQEGDGLGTHVWRTSADNS
ncbi:unnamed protein product, partial [Brassica rapa subsp. narinosa]